MAENIFASIQSYIERHAMDMLRIALAIVFIWFGMLKIFWLSPANALITQTVFWFDSSWFIPALGVWEIIIGVFFLVPKFTKYVLWIMLPQMMGTFLPLIVLFEKAFQGNLLAPTMEGQYIIKNLVLISGALVVVVYTAANDGKYGIASVNTKKPTTVVATKPVSREKISSVKVRKRR